MTKSKSVMDGRDKQDNKAPLPRPDGTCACPRCDSEDSRTPGSANTTTTTSSSRSTFARAASATRRRAGRCGHPHARRRAPRAAARRRAPTPRRSRSRTWCPAQLPRRQRRSRR
ncbi:hypothetical protein NFJ02_24g56440 [Pycnococcus provasolii]